MLEFTMALPLLLLLLFGCVQFAQLWMARLMTNYAAFCAARAALVTVVDEAGPSSSNDSWPTQQELPYEGLKDPFTKLGSIGLGMQGFAKSEAQWAGSKAAQQVCAWTILGGSGLTLNDMNIPGWGKIPGTDASERKVRTVVKFSNWNVEATVENDFALIMPVIGPVIAWGVNPWDEEKPWAEQTKDPTDDAHRFLDKSPYPHIRITAKVTLPKPYRTIIAAGNWKGTPPPPGLASGW
jgi:hypothetical protein